MVGQTSSRMVSPRGCLEEHLRQIPHPRMGGGANLIEDDESKRGGVCNTLGKSHIGRGQERTEIYKECPTSNTNNAFWGLMLVDEWRTPQLSVLGWQQFQDGWPSWEGFTRATKSKSVSSDVAKRTILVVWGAGCYNYVLALIVQYILCLRVCVLVI